MSLRESPLCDFDAFTSASRLLARKNDWITCPRRRRFPVEGVSVSNGLVIRESATRIISGLRSSSLISLTGPLFCPGQTDVSVGHACSRGANQSGCSDGFDSL